MQPRARAADPALPSARPVAKPAPPTIIVEQPLSENPFVLEPDAEIIEEMPIEAPSDGIPTLFAEELISEKSLDEVILAFLSADLEQGK
jgi:hypothetical protein